MDRQEPEPCRKVQPKKEGDKRKELAYKLKELAWTEQMELHKNRLSEEREVRLVRSCK